MVGPVQPIYVPRWATKAKASALGLWEWRPTSPPILYLRGTLRMPERVQLSRAKGWRMPENTVKVDRATMWGNWAAWRAGVKNNRVARDLFRAWVENEASAAWKGRVAIDLRGKNLACWCKPGEPCHADVLLRLANPPPLGNSERG